MNAEKLFENIKTVGKADLKNLECGQIKVDSNKVAQGDVFVCLRGESSDGHDYAKQALQNGAKIVVCEKDLGLKNQVLVDDCRSAFSLLCKNYYKKACEKLKIIAITGTNGKTTVSHLCGQLFQKLGRNAGVIGTLGAFYNGKVVQTKLTTPDPDQLHKILFDMANSGVEYVFMEESAHAIALKKTEGIKFELAVLTNITQDHLDYFKDINNYAQTKLSLFDQKYCKRGLVCTDNIWGKTLFFKENNIPMFSYGLEGVKDFYAMYPSMTLEGSKFYVSCLGSAAEVKSRLVGNFNVQNILASLAVCDLCGLEVEDAAKKIKEIEPIDGRFNVIKSGGVNVVVDYAHTPDGLENLLKTVRQVSNGRVITVFGCGGNRDRAKRPIMGKVASKHSSYCILTSDNPRFENPMDIINEIEIGMSGKYEVCADRSQAIKRGLEIARKGDTVVIAGKGAETYQEICGQKLPFDDKQQVYNFISLRKDKLEDEYD